MNARMLIGTSLAAAVIAAGALAGTPGAAAQEAVESQSAAPSVPGTGVVAFYFHGDVRCATCRKIEAYADEAIHSAFSAELETGALAWRTINIDVPENKHFINDFQLTTRSVVLAEYRDHEIVRWKNLSRVWQLVRSQDGFTEYVQGETREFLEEG